MKRKGTRGLAVASFVVSCLLQSTVKAQASLGRVFVLTIESVVNEGFLQDDYECGGDGDDLDEINLAYESADQEIQALEDVSFSS